MTEGGDAGTAGTAIGAGTGKRRGAGSSVPITGLGMDVAGADKPPCAPTGASVAPWNAGTAEGATGPALGPALGAMLGPALGPAVGPALGPAATAGASRAGAPEPGMAGREIVGAELAAIVAGSMARPAIGTRWLGKLCVATPGTMPARRPELATGAATGAGEGVEGAAGTGAGAATGEGAGTVAVGAPASMGCPTSDDLP